MDLWSLYSLMKKSRQFEEAVTQLWQDGLISGEMHLGTGEEAIIAGVVSQLRSGDAMAVDHRGSAAFLMRGVDPVLLLREMLGQMTGCVAAGAVTCTCSQKSIWQPVRELWGQEDQPQSDSPWPPNTCAPEQSRSPFLARGR